MSTMMRQFICIALASNADHESKISSGSRLHSGNGIFEHNGPPRLNPKEPCRPQERVRGGFPSKTFVKNSIAIDPHLEELL